MQPPLARPRRSPRPAPLLAALGLIVALPSVAGGGALLAGGSHVGETHSAESHHAESLRAIDLSLADLGDTDLARSDLKNALFVDAFLSSADLSWSVLHNADLSGADLRDADLSDAVAKNANFSDALLGGAVLDGANLWNADFAGAELMGADLSNAVNADRADFGTAYFDATTAFSPDMDADGMYEVVGACPSDPQLAHVDTDGDGVGDECHELRSMPEPEALGLLCAGAMMLFALPRGKSRRQASADAVSGFANSVRSSAALRSARRTGLPR